MNSLKDLLSARVLKVLGICFAMMLFTSNGVTAADQGTFDIEAVKAKYSVRDYVYQPLPERGYNYYKIAENAYFVHDDFENQVFFVTDVGVVVYDAKPDVTPYLLKVVKEVTDKPITHVIYSHHHRDHAEGMHLYPKDAIKIANDETARLLKRANDPKRPMPDIVWEVSYVLETGGLRLELKDLPENWHSQSDTLAYAPQQKRSFGRSYRLLLLRMVQATLEKITSVPVYPQNWQLQYLNLIISGSVMHVKMPIRVKSMNHQDLFLKGRFVRKMKQ